MIKKKRKKKEKIIVANWKMNPPTSKEALKIFKDFKKQKHSQKNVTTVFCPPYTFIKDLKKNYAGSKIFFGAQDLFYERQGAYTGEVSVDMIKDLGARFVIVGHSERRALGETNEIVAKKVLASLTSGLHTVLCIGEKHRDVEGKYLKELSVEIHKSLEGIPASLTKRLIIAYEPVWAIGEGNQHMNPNDMQFISLFIQKQLIKIFNRKVAKQVPVLYGGSVNSDNANEFTTCDECDGLFVGRSSLNPFEFSKIVDSVSKNLLK